MSNPDSLNPLAAATVQERIRAFYIARGYNRATFARALGVGYTVVANWEQKEKPYMPGVELLRQTAELLRVTTDDLVFGLDPRPEVLPPSVPTQGHGVSILSIDYTSLRKALDRVDASAEARDALIEHMESPRGQLQRVTLDYALAFVGRWEEAKRAGKTAEAAEREAYRAAVNARAEVHARTGSGRSKTLAPVAPKSKREPGPGSRGGARNEIRARAASKRGKVHRSG